MHTQRNKRKISEMPEKTQHTDQELVELSLQDSEQFYFLMKKYEKQLIRYIRRISLFSIESAEDILQEVFIKTYKNLHNYDPCLKFSSWIYRITHNETINFLRRHKTQPQTVSLTSENDPDYDLLNILPDKTNIPSELHQEELISKIRETIKSLPTKYREILILRYVEDKSYEEISDILRKSTGTISTQINRAKKHFKKIAKKNNLTNY